MLMAVRSTVLAAVVTGVVRVTMMFVIVVMLRIRFLVVFVFVCHCGSLAFASPVPS